MKNTVYCIASTEPQANDISHNSDLWQSPAQ